MSTIYDLDTEGTANVTTGSTLRGSTFANRTSTVSATTSVIIESYQQTSAKGPTYSGTYAIGMYNGILLVYGGFTVLDGVQNKIGGLWAYNTTASAIVIGSTTFPSKAWIQPPNVSNPGTRSDMCYGVVGSKFFLWGGVDANNTAYNDFWAYDMTSLTWSLIASSTTPSARGGAACTVIGTKFYIIAGNHLGTLTNDMYVYDFSNSTWTILFSSIPGMSTRGNTCATNDGTHIYLSGGSNASNVGIQDFWTYTVAGSTWASFGGTKPPARFWSSMAYWNGAVYLHDGTNALDGPSLGDMWKYTVATTTWSQVTGVALPNTRMGHKLVQNGSLMYVYGGYSAHGYGPPPLGDGCYNDLWVCDLSLGTLSFSQLPGGMVWVSNASVTVNGWTLSVSIVNGKIKLKATATSAVGKASSINLSNLRVLYT